MVKHDQTLFLIISMCSSSAKRASMSSFEKKQGRILKRIGIRVTTLGLALNMPRIQRAIWQTYLCGCLMSEQGGMVTSLEKTLPVFSVYKLNATQMHAGLGPGKFSKCIWA